MSVTENTAITQAPPADDLRAEVRVVKELFTVAAERLTAVETRLAPVEIAVAKIPSLEAHLSRVDTMLLTMQGDIRRMEKSSNEHSIAIETKLDDLKMLILAMTKAP